MTEQEFKNLQRENLEIDRAPKVTRGAVRSDSIIRFDESEIQRHPLPVNELMPIAGGLMQQPTNGMIDGQALAAVESVSERSTPIDRAKATGIRMALGMGASAIVVIVLAIAGLDVVTLAIIEVVGCVVAFVVALWLEQRDSPLAVERHKAKEYSNIRKAEISSQERMFNRRMDTLERIMGAMIYGHSRKDNRTN